LKLEKKWGKTPINPPFVKNTISKIVQTLAPNDLSVSVDVQWVGDETDGNKPAHKLKI
jgi:hypothetical protein